MKQYQEYKDSGIPWIGKVPASWDISALRHSVECLDGKRIPVETTQRAEMQGDIPYWGAGNIVDYVDRALFDEELILLGEDGAPFFDYTRPVAFHITEPIWANNHIHVLRAKPNTDAEYIVHALNAVDYKEYINGAILNKLTQSAMNRIKIPLPALETQKRISAYLNKRITSINKVIDQKNELIDLLQEKRTSTISTAVTKGIDFTVEMCNSGIDWLGEVPAHWQILTNHQLFAERNIKCSEPDAVLLSVTKHLGVILQSQAEEMNLATVAPAETTEGYKVVRKGDLVMNIMRAKDGSYGISDYDGVISPAYCIYYTRQEANPQYLYYLFKTPMYMEIFKNYSTGIAEHRMRLYPVSFFKIPVVVPPLEEQNEIVAYLDKRVKDIDELITLTQQQIEKLKEYRQSIISEVVTGKVAVE